MGSVIMQKPFHRRDLLDAVEIVRSGVSPTTMNHALIDGSFPPPTTEVPGLPLWFREEIEMWLARHATQPRYFARG
jgi:predicted DNA-binding transcriptional regulator AlpA